VHELVEAGDVVKDGWNGYNILHDAASRVAALDLGFLPSAEVLILSTLSPTHKTTCAHLHALTTPVFVFSSVVVEIKK